MLKKVLLGFICFVVLAASAVGIYLYTLDWNKQKSVIADRFSQITGLKAAIDGNLNVKLFPSPKLTANKVKFLSPNGKNPLVTVTEITANLDLIPLLDSKFVIRSMNLTQANVNIEISETGVSNWNGVDKNSKNKSGNTEVSFNDIRLANLTITYKNLKENEEITIPNISASISAPSLGGPYKTDGKFIYNNNEMRFNGIIVKDKDLKTNLTISNASTATKFIIDGSLGSEAKGTITFDTQRLANIAAIILKKDTPIIPQYNFPLYFSFQYDYAQGLAKLNNFTARYGRNTAGSGNVVFKPYTKNKEIVAEFNLTKFDLELLNNLRQDFIALTQSEKNLSDYPISNYDAVLNLKSDSVWYKDIEAQNFNLGVTLQNGILDVTRLGIQFPGDSYIKMVGKINLNTAQYVFNQNIDTKDLRTLAAIFDIDLTKLTPADNKKSVFKKALADLSIKGDTDSVTISIPKAVVDSINFSGNIGYAEKEKQAYLLAELDFNKILFDRYLTPVPTDLKNKNLQQKLIYQLNLLPWNKEIEVDADINVNSAVYNNIPLEDIHLQFSTHSDSLNVKKLAVGNIAGAELNMMLKADHIYTSPYFQELTYDIKTTNFPNFITTMGIQTSDIPLFKRKTFASQGALSGSMDKYNLSSIQKFGDIEFSYTGNVVNPTEGRISVEGDIELKTNNFSKFIKAFDLNYQPDIPVSTFSFSGKVKGTNQNFACSDVMAYLGSNNIVGSFAFDNTADLPSINAKLNFDKFEVDRLLNLAKKTSSVSSKSVQDFISKPTFDTKKIDYSSLGDVNFNVDLAAKLATYNNKNYADTKFNAILNNKTLKVNNLEAKRDDSYFKTDFVLDTLKIPSVTGNYIIKNAKLSSLGGSMYAIDGGIFDTEGNFSSTAVSEKDFWDKLNAKGEFSLSNTSIVGWDLDIIKFELEQRKSVAGFENIVLNSLKNGKSNFTKISGNYIITNGLIISEDTLFESPVANLTMALSLNMNDWLFSAAFDTVYHNASFSDVVKFSYMGNLANPAIKLDVSESIQRIGTAEKISQEAQRNKEKEQLERIQNKITSLQNEIKNILLSTSRLSYDIVRFKPSTNNKDIVSTYDINSKAIAEAELRIKQMESSLTHAPTEDKLMDIETSLAMEKSKLDSIPKILEDNYVIDSKYIFEDTFNKIAWVYDLASNNTAYYNGLTDIYLKQLKILKSANTPVDEQTEKKLLNGINVVSKDMDKINRLHTKIRDNYLTIIDSARISQMKDNNELATQALQTILSYTKQLNADIIANLDDFRSALEIKARDYDEFIIYPPENAKDIDISKPVMNVEKTKDTSLDSKKKIDDLTKNLSEVKSGLGNFFAKYLADADEKKEITVASSSVDIDPEVSKPETNAPQTTTKEENAEPIVVAENTDTKKDKIASQKNTPVSENTLQVASVKEPTAKNETVMEKTKSAFNDIVSKIKQTEKNLKTIFMGETPEEKSSPEKKSDPDTTVEKKTAAAFDVNIADYTLPVSAPQKTYLKKNPVIAMEIGKKLTPSVNTQFNNFNKRSGFKTKNNFMNNVISSLPAAPEFTKNLVTHNPDTSIEEIMVVDIKPLSSVKDNLSPDILEDNKMSEEYTLTRAKILPETNKYVFSTQSTIAPSAENLGKSILKNQIAPEHKEVNNKYIFASNNLSQKLSGLSAKNMTLVVK